MMKPAATLIAMVGLCFGSIAADGHLSAASDSAVGAVAEQPASSPATAPTSAAPRLPKHIFLIVLENESYEDTFGSDAPASCVKALKTHGELLDNYYGIGHNSLDNYIAMISGQGPNPATQLDCREFSKFRQLPPSVLGKLEKVTRDTKQLEQLTRHFLHLKDGGNAPIDTDGQVKGWGCVYPREVETVANQIQDNPAHLSWGAFMEDMHKPCDHPGEGEDDPTQIATKESQYAVRHNPFVYFHSIIDDQQLCNEHDRPLDELPHYLSDATLTPNLVFITPNLCSDGHDQPCVTGERRVDGVSPTDRFLGHWVRLIEASPAFRADGVLIITFDEADVKKANDLSWDVLAKPDQPGQPRHPDATECCHDPETHGVHPGLFGPGGGRVGAIIISPFVRPGSQNHKGYNHYSLLKSVEDLLQLPSHLGYANRPYATFQEGGVFNQNPPLPAPADLPAQCPAPASAPGGPA